MLVMVRTKNDDITLNDIVLTAEKPALIKLAPNFTLAEMANNAGDATKPQYIFTDDSSEFINTLQIFREIVNQRVIVNSGFRQVDYNRKIGGASDSRHIFGQAADIQPIIGYDAKQHIAAWAKALGYTGHRGAINIYKNHEYYHIEINDSIAPLLLIRVYSTIDEFKELKKLEDKSIYVQNYIKQVKLWQ